MLPKYDSGALVEVWRFDCVQNIITLLSRFLTTKQHLQHLLSAENFIRRDTEGFEFYQWRMELHNLRTSFWPEWSEIYVYCMLRSQQSSKYLTFVL